ncbi:hypothetical protein DMP23_20555 [Amycolatopsis sp. A1MSW2902]|uniref:methyltransferase n=1 Tax=Amycolatopsis sp. A1MSW2902 TaxID=687413 RepID=UPI00307EB093
MHDGTSADDLAAAPAWFRLNRMFMSAWIPQAVHAAAELRIPDELAARSMTAADLADRVGADPDRTRRLLRGLAVLGIVAESADGTFTLSPVGEPLRTDAPDGVRSLALFMSGDVMWGAWRQLAACVRTGPQAWELDDAPATDVRDEHAAEFDLLHQAMFEQSRQTAPAIANAYDFSWCATVVDVGGGHGTLLAAVLDANPSTRGIVFDRPDARAGAEKLIVDRALQDRAEFVGGDFLAAVPAGSDAYVIKNVLHDWGDERCVAILRNCAAAMADDGRVLVAEPVAPERFGTSATDDVLTAIDLVLMNSGGRLRTEAEHSGLHTAAGLRLERFLPASGGNSVMVLIPE